MFCVWCGCQKHSQNDTCLLQLQLLRIHTSRHQMRQASASCTILCCSSTCFSRLNACVWLIKFGGRKKKAHNLLSIFLEGVEFLISWKKPETQQWLIPENTKIGKKYFKLSLKSKYEGKSQFMWLAVIKQHLYLQEMRSTCGTVRALCIITLENST